MEVLNIKVKVDFSCTSDCERLMVSNDVQKINVNKKVNQCCDITERGVTSSLNI